MIEDPKAGTEQGDTAFAARAEPGLEEPTRAARVQGAGQDSNPWPRDEAGPALAPPPRAHLGGAGASSGGASSGACGCSHADRSRPRQQSPRRGSAGAAGPPATAGGGRAVVAAGQLAATRRSEGPDCSATTGADPPQPASPPD